MRNKNNVFLNRVEQYLNFDLDRNSDITRKSNTSDQTLEQPREYFQIS